MKFLVTFLAVAAFSTHAAAIHNHQSEVAPRAAKATASVKADASVVNAPDLGPALGDKIPHDLTVLTSAGVETNFEELVGEKGLALFFVRSVDWCPFCRAQAVDVNTRLADFRKRGINVAFVSYDVPAKQSPFVKKWDFEPALLSDEKIEIIDAFGLRNETHKEGSRFFGIPHPAVFIINSEKAIVGKLYEDDYVSNAKSYRERPAVDLILDVVDGAFTADE